MTTTNTSWFATFNNSTDAAFRAWGLAMSTALQGIGLIKTADTGQIDWSTVLFPNVATQSRGYEIYRLNDSLQATYPIFFRFDYGSGYSAPASAIRIQIGTGTNGAGVISGLMYDTHVTQFVQSNNYHVQIHNGAVTLPMTCMASGDGEFVYFNWNAAAYTNYALHFMFERSRDVNGNTTGDGIFVGLCGAQASSTATSRLVYAAYGSSTNNMIMNLISTQAGLTLPAFVNGLNMANWPGTPISKSPTIPFYMKIVAVIPGICSWNVRHFLMPLAHADVSLAPTFRTDPDGKGSKVFRVVPLGSSGMGIVGYGAVSVPIAFTWAD